MKKMKIFGWMGMLMMLCIFASCSDKDEPQPEPTPDPTPEVSEPPKATVSLKEFQEKVVGKFWHPANDAWISSDGAEHGWAEVGFVGGFGVDKYDFLSNDKCDIYHNYYGTDKVPGKGWAYSTENFVYDEKTGYIYFKKASIPDGQINWEFNDIFIESVSDTELVIRTYFDWQSSFDQFELPENAWESYLRRIYVPCTPEEIAKYKEDYVYMEF